MMKNIFVVMPAYNAGKTIEKVFNRIPKDVRERIKRYVVVDDGSRDNTQEALARIKRTFSNLSVIRHAVNRGYGAAEKNLLNYCIKNKAEISVLLHADGQYSPERIPDLLYPMEKGDADLVQGSRMLGGGALQGGMPFYKYIANKLLTAVENWGFKMKMAEYHSGYMVYSRKCLATIPFNRLSNSFEFDLEMIVMAKILGLRIKEVSIPTIYGDEVSYLSPIKYGFDVLGVVKKYRHGYYHSLLGNGKGGVG